MIRRTPHIPAELMARATVKGVRLPKAQTSEPKRRRGVMNGLETRFAREVLDVMKAAGEIDGYAFESMKLLVAAAGDETKASYYCLDFVTWKGAVVRGFETKGWWRPAERLRVKVVAERNPWIAISGVRWEGRAWVYERFGRATP